MEKLFIKIGNEVIYPQKPKAYVWRKIMEFDEKFYHIKNLQGTKTMKEEYQK